MSDEPLYCTQCGAEDFDCECHEELPDGPFCAVCGTNRKENNSCSCDRRTSGGFMMFIQNVLWAVRHPIYAACWCLTGKPFSVVFGR